MKQFNNMNITTEQCQANREFKEYAEKSDEILALLSVMVHKNEDRGYLNFGFNVVDKNGYTLNLVLKELNGGFHHNAYCHLNWELAYEG